MSIFAEVGPTATDMHLLFYTILGDIPSLTAFLSLLLSIFRILRLSTPVGRTFQPSVVLVPRFRHGCSHGAGILPGQATSRSLSLEGALLVSWLLRHSIEEV